MIKIQVLGSGMIPRDLGIAPRKEPFYADRDVIYTILNTPGLSINYLHPENGRFFPLTRENMKKVLDKFKNATYDKPVATVPPARPHVPEPKKEDPKPEEKKVEEKKPVAPPPPPAHVEPPKPTTAPQPVSAPKVEPKTEEPKKEDPKPEEKKVEEKKDEKKDDKPAASSGLKPVVATEKK